MTTSRLQPRAGFPKKVRRRALAESARRCCVCHTFKGTRLEVHHIVPLSEGGDNSFENAIVLCLDCHADAGHYNASHPKGSRYSPEELRMHRDRWYEAVRKGHLKPARGSFGLVVARHLICTSFDIGWHRTPCWLSSNVWPHRMTNSLTRIPTQSGSCQDLPESR